MRSALCLHCSIEFQSLSLSLAPFLLVSFYFAPSIHLSLVLFAARFPKAIANKKNFFGAHASNIESLWSAGKSSVTLKIWNSAKFNSIIHAMPMANETMRHVSYAYIFHSVRINMQIGFTFSHSIFFFHRWSRVCKAYHGAKETELLVLNGIQIHSHTVLNVIWIWEFRATSSNAWIQMNTCRHERTSYWIR